MAETRCPALANSSQMSTLWKVRRMTVGQCSHFPFISDSKVYKINFKAEPMTREELFNNQPMTREELFNQPMTREVLFNQPMTREKLFKQQTVREKIIHLYFIRCSQHSSTRMYSRFSTKMLSLLMLVFSSTMECTLVFLIKTSPGGRRMFSRVRGA